MGSSGICLSVSQIRAFGTYTVKTLISTPGDRRLAKDFATIDAKD
jgi:hypothetical protein